MRAHLVHGLLAVMTFPTAALAQSVAADQAAAAPHREKVTCARYRATVEKTSQSAMFDTRIKPGSWGRVPTGLRKLPKHAKLCGADSLGQAVIVSPLFGKQLEEHYAPLFAKLDFQPLTCEISNGQTRCRCKRRRDLGILVTDATSEAFVLSFMARAPARPHGQSAHDR
jgi:hypothetical protein